MGETGWPGTMMLLGITLEILAKDFRNSDTVIQHVVMTTVAICGDVVQRQGDLQVTSNNSNDKGHTAIKRQHDQVDEATSAVLCDVCMESGLINALAETMLMHFVNNTPVVLHVMKAFRKVALCSIEQWAAFKSAACVGALLHACNTLLSVGGSVFDNTLQGLVYIATNPNTDSQKLLLIEEGGMRLGLEWVAISHQKSDMYEAITLLASLSSLTVSSSSSGAQWPTELMLKTRELTILLTKTFSIPTINLSSDPDQPRSPAMVKALSMSFLLNLLRNLGTHNKARECAALVSPHALPELIPAFRIIAGTAFSGKESVNVVLLAQLPLICMLLGRLVLHTPPNTGTIIDDLLDIVNHELLLIVERCGSDSRSVLPSQLCTSASETFCGPLEGSSGSYPQYGVLQRPVTLQDYLDDIATTCGFFIAANCSSNSKHMAALSNDGAHRLIERGLASQRRAILLNRTERDICRKMYAFLKDVAPSLPTPTVPTLSRKSSLSGVQASSMGSACEDTPHLLMSKMEEILNDGDVVQRNQILETLKLQSRLQTSSLMLETRIMQVNTVLQQEMDARVALRRLFINEFGDTLMLELEHLSANESATRTYVELQWFTEHDNKLYQLCKAAKILREKYGGHFIVPANQVGMALVLRAKVFFMEKSDRKLLEKGEDGVRKATQALFNASGGLVTANPLNRLKKLVYVVMSSNRAPNQKLLPTIVNQKTPDYNARPFDPEWHLRLNKRKDQSPPWSPKETNLSRQQRKDQSPPWSPNETDLSRRQRKDQSPPWSPNETNLSRKWTEKSLKEDPIDLSHDQMEEGPKVAHRPSPDSSRKGESFQRSHVEASPVEFANTARHKCIGAPMVARLIRHPTTGDIDTTRPHDTSPTNQRSSVEFPDIPHKNKSSPPGERKKFKDIMTRTSGIVNQSVSSPVSPSSVYVQHARSPRGTSVSFTYDHSPYVKKQHSSRRERLKPRSKSSNPVSLPNIPNSSRR